MPMDTRDIAVEARSLVNQHMEDCSNFRQALVRTFEEIKSDAKDMRTDIKALNTRSTWIVGGIVGMAKALDYAAPLLKHLLP